MTLEPGTLIDRRYVVRNKIAEGGMAEIYLAQVQGAEGFEKDVVIKRIRSFLAGDPEFVQMFIAEARVASKLNHANIVQIFGFDKHEDSYYIAMEYVRGRSLWDVRRRCREQLVPMPPAIVAQIGSEVARGLHYAHRLSERGTRLGLVHRDVTPHNVLLSWEGAVKLTDFGIAKVGNKLTSSGMLKGKFAYMSPEQARGEEVDARTDVFALGIVLWEMLTGGRLFEGDSDVAVLRAVQQSNIAPPGRLNPDVHPDLDAVVMRALERDLSKRFATAQELERALGQFILSHARSIDDTDVGGFLRPLFADDLAPDGGDRRSVSVSARRPELTEERPARREPTAVLAGTPSRPATPPEDPDEDVNAPTWVVARGQLAPPTEKLPTADSPVPPRPREKTAVAGGAADAAVARPRQQSGVDGTGAEQRPEAMPQPQPSRQVAEAPAPPAVAAPDPVVTAEDRRGPQAAGRDFRGRRLAAIGAVVAGVVAIATVAAVVTRGPDAPVEDAQTAATADDAGAQVAFPAPAQDAGAPVAVAAAQPEPPRQTAPAAAVVPPEPDAGAADPEARELAVRPANAGTVIITASPWAIVFIDGDKRGEVAGAKPFVLPAGKYHFRLQHTRKTVEKIVTVRPRKTQRLDFDVFTSQ